MNEKPVRTPVIVYQTKQEPTDDFTGKFHMTSPVNFKITGIPVMEMVKNMKSLCNRVYNIQGRPQQGWSRVSRSGNLVHDAQWYDFATVLIPSKDIFNNIDPVF